MDATRTRNSRFFLSDALAMAGILTALAYGVFVLLNTSEAIMYVDGALFAGFGAGGLLTIAIRRRCEWAGTVYRNDVVIAHVAGAAVWGIADFFLSEYLAGRALHTSAVVSACCGNLLFAVSFYSVQRACKARLSGFWAPWFVFWGFQVLIVMAGAGYMTGVSEGKEYMEPAWYSDIWLTILWAVSLTVLIGTALRNQAGYLALLSLPFILVIAVIGVLHIGNNAAVPASFASTKSFAVYAGVQDAFTQWWYSHRWPWR